MYTLTELKPIMQQQLAEDANRQYVNVSADTLEDALREAAVELSLPMKKIEYEILERGSSGIMGLGKRPFLIVAYPVTGKSGAQQKNQHAQDTRVETPVLHDGQVFVRLTAQGIMLKVTKPDANMQPVTPDMALEAIRQRSSVDINERLVKTVVHMATDEYVRIGDYAHNPVADPQMSVHISENQMNAWLRVFPPLAGGSDPSVADIMAYLRSEGVTEGLKTDAIREFEDNPLYNQTVSIATGKPPKAGRNAEIVLNFEKNVSRSRVQIIGDKVDFHELNLVQNVVEGQILAKKYPPHPGEDGITVTGEIRYAEPGNDVQFKIDKNVILSEDGNVATAAINGQVVYESDTIHVEPVYVINGDVNLKTGNIMFLGTVIVKGNITDGFHVKATGDIEVTGSVGKAILNAEQNIIVHGGIAGKNDAVVHCGNNLWSRFIENTNVDADGLVVVSDGIINSDVSSRKKVICRGKRASIVGGIIRAISGVDAKSIGSVAGSPTLIETGVDPKCRKEYIKLESEIKRAEEERSEVRLNLRTYKQMKAVKRKIPRNRLEYYEGLDQRFVELNDLLKRNHERMVELQEYLATISGDVKISAHHIVHPGVKINIKDATLDVRNEFKNLSFVLENGVIKIAPYEEMKDNIEIHRGK